jgi:hypothetical protein
VALLRKWKGNAGQERLLPVDAPDNVVQAMVHKKCGPNIPLIRGIVNAPTIRNDGSLFGAVRL